MGGEEDNPHFSSSFFLISLLFKVDFIWVNLVNKISITFHSSEFHHEHAIFKKCDAHSDVILFYSMSMVNFIPFPTDFMPSNMT